MSTNILWGVIRTFLSKILAAILDFKMAAIPLQFGSGTPSRLKAIIMRNIWGKFGAFIRHVHFLPHFGPKPLHYDVITNEHFDI